MKMKLQLKIEQVEMDNQRKPEFESSTIVESEIPFDLLIDLFYNQHILKDFIKAVTAKLFFIVTLKVNQNSLKRN